MQRAPEDAARQKETICSGIRENAAFTAPYVTMNALATVVACYGLLQNSAAVVIGAMIIAMLLGPISGIALGLVTQDNALLRRAILAEAGGVAVVLTVAFCIGMIHRDLPLTEQILSRTSPNILDLMIALAGGAAGAYATVSPRLSVGLVGVAISTALVPPLATCSICLAHGEPRLAFGGFLLFFANLVAIQFSYSVVMFLNGYHRLAGQAVDPKNLLRRNAVSLALLIALAIVLGYDFSQSISKQQFQEGVRAALKRQLRAYPGVYLADLRFRTDPDHETVVAVVRAPDALTPDQVAAIQAKLPQPKGSRLELHVRSVITKEATSTGYVNEAPQTQGADGTQTTGP